MICPTPAQMKLIEEITDKNGNSYENMMENAGASVTKHICNLLVSENISGEILILCGNGNNGGDGFVIAKNLAMIGIPTKIILTCGEPKSLLAKQKLTEISYEISLGIITTFELITLDDELFSNAKVIVDAVYGTGFHGEFSPEISELFSIVNATKAHKIAVDLSSGGNALTGEICENAFVADFTVTFAYQKIGMLLSPLCDILGEIIIEDIGVCEDKIAEISFLPEIYSDREILSYLPERSRYGYKNNYGHLLNIAGSSNMSGAACLSTSSALRSGVGLVTLASTESVVNRAAVNIYEAMYLPLKSNSSGQIAKSNLEEILQFSKKVSAVSIGCGLGVSKDSSELVKNLLLELDCDIILDADGINSILSCIDIIKSTKKRLIITPHFGELKRIYTAYYNDASEVDRLTAAITLAKELGVIIVAKGYPTYVVGDGKTAVLFAGNSGLSKGGSGDVLTGIIAGLIASGISPFEASVLGVFLHGKAADYAENKLSAYAMLPSDVINNLPFVFNLN